MLPVNWQAGVLVFVTELWHHVNHPRSAHDNHTVRSICTFQNCQEHVYISKLSGACTHFKTVWSMYKFQNCQGHMYILKLSGAYCQEHFKTVRSMCTFQNCQEHVYISKLSGACVHFKTVRSMCTFQNCQEHVSICHFKTLLKWKTFLKSTVQNQSPHKYKINPHTNTKSIPTQIQNQSTHKYVTKHMVHKHKTHILLKSTPSKKKSCTVSQFSRTFTLTLSSIHQFPRTSKASKEGVGVRISRTFKPPKDGMNAEEQRTDYRHQIL